MSDQRESKSVADMVELFDQILPQGIVYMEGEFETLRKKISNKKANPTPEEYMRYADLLLENGRLQIVDKIKTAADYYKKAADKGNVESMLRYAKIMFVNDRIGNKRETIKYYTKAAKEGSTRAMVELATFYTDNPKKAEKYYLDAIDKGDAEAMYNYSVQLSNPTDRKDIITDKEKSLHYCKLAADSGHIEAIKVYANMLYNGDGIEQNKAMAAEYYKEAAEREDIPSMRLYADMLYNGDGIEQNKAMAAEYYKKIFETPKKNDTHEKLIIDTKVVYANILYNGDGINQDKVKAAEYYKEASEELNGFACFLYANMLYSGDGIEQNKAEAAKYYKETIKILSEDTQEYITAYLNYCDILFTMNEEENINEAIFNYKLLADKGNVEAIKKYADILFTGNNGSPKNEKEALKYYKKLADKTDNIEAIISYADKTYDIYKDETNEQIKKEKIKETEEYYKRAINKDSLEAMEKYGNLLYNTDRKTEAFFTYDFLLSNENLALNEIRARIIRKCLNMLKTKEVNLEPAKEAEEIKKYENAINSLNDTVLPKNIEI